jgi:hypothetical protein
MSISASNTDDTCNNSCCCPLFMGLFPKLWDTITIEELKNELVSTILYDNNGCCSCTFKTIGISLFSNDFLDLFDKPKFSIQTKDSTCNFASCCSIWGFLTLIVIVVKPIVSIKSQSKYKNLCSLLRSQFLYRQRTLPSNATSLLPSLMSSTDTTSLGFKVIVARNATKH